MDWDQARIFLAVARTGQLLGAARRLGINHATVARQLSALETGLGVKLVERMNAGCTLTPAGEQFLPAAEAAEAGFLRVAAQLSGITANVGGTVRVGAPEGLGNTLLAPALAALSDRHPELVIQLVPLPRTFSLSKREADIAIVLDRPQKGRLITRKLSDYTLGVYAAQEHLARHGPIRSEDDVRTRLHITQVEEFSYSAALDYGATLRRLMPKRFECGSVAGQLNAIREGHGIGVVHDYVAARHPELVRVLPEIAFRRTYWITSHPDVHNTRRVREVYACILEAVERERGSLVRA
ncbi:LysR family transcriptional regulator [Terrihabitans sp. B22-R8]|uniref:LysR family transcriptional regulator n=1 Tax=Terrihabitans sp. B22-R8 TaxID=3425128 RepID=UPI00403D0C53